MNTIVLGVDSSKGSQAAARWAAKLAREASARVVAVHVMPRSELWTIAAFQVDARPVVDDLRAQLDGPWTAPLRKATIRYTTKFVRGDAANELLRVATRLNAMMLVVGARSHSSVHDLVVGGTVHKIINRSTVPVVLVPVASRRTTTQRPVSTG